MDEKLTSFKVDGKLLEEFQINGIKYKVTIRKLAERSMYLFIKDETFRKKILDTLNIDLES